MDAACRRNLYKIFDPESLSFLKYIVFFLLLLLCSCAQFSQVPDGKKFFSHDGSAIARVEKGVVYTNGVKSALKFDGIERSGIVFSKDGKHFSYLGIRGNKIYFVINETEYGPYDGCSSSGIQSAPEGSGMGVGMIKNSKWVVNINGQERGPYEKIQKMSPLFSNNGEHIAYGALKDEKWMMIWDGVDGKAYDSLSFPAFSNQGNHMAYAAEKSGKWLLIRDGQESQQYNAFLNGSPAFLPNGKLIYSTRKNYKWYVRINDRIIKRYDKILKPGILVSPDRSTVALVGIRADRMYALINGIEQGPFDRIGIWDDDADSVIRLIASLEPSVHNPDQAVPRRQEVKSTLVFSNDGQHYAYLADLGDQSFIIVNGAKFLEVPIGEVKSIKFTADSKSIEYELRSEKSKNVVRLY